MSVNIGGQAWPLDTTEIIIEPFDGPIPPRIGRLVDLQVLDLKGNLTGGIPQEIFLLSKLVRLSLRPDELHEGLQGPIPKEIGRLVRLEELDLRENGLTSSVPSHLGRLESLSSLRLFENFLTGALPTEVGNLARLTRLNLRNNELSGQMPAELGDLVLLNQLRLQVNKLTGTLPPEIGRLVQLTRLVLEGSEQNIGGAIPASLANLERLLELNLAENAFVGQLPPELGRLESLEQLLVGGNQLNGTVPRSILELPNLQGLGLSRNKFSGIELLDSRSLTSLDLAGNRFEQLPELSLPGLYELFLENNQLQEIPSGLNKSALLETLSVSNNTLRSFPSGIQEFGNLLQLMITDSEIAGIVPDLSGLSNLYLLDLSRNSITEIEGLPDSLQELYLEDNEIDGPLSSLITPDLFELDITNNQLSGNLAVLEDLFGLSVFRGGDNKFSGSLPDLSKTGVRVFVAPNNELSGGLDKLINASSASLRVLDLTNNQLEGVIPATIGSMTLTQLRLQSNLLNGSIPEELWGMNSLRVLTLAGNNLEGELSRGIENLKPLLATLTLGLEVTCDCHLLEWYPEFVQTAHFNERDKIAVCNDKNEFHGVYAHLLQSEPRAPCSHPAFISDPLSDEPRSISITLDYDENYNITKNTEFSSLGWTLTAPTSAEAFGAENSKLFRDCSLFKTPPTFEGTVVAGFELQWHPPGLPEQVRSLCSLESTIEVDGLDSFRNYSVFGRAFLLYFSQSTGDSEISYVFGPQSAAFRVKSKASPPVGVVQNINIFEREAKRIELIWDEVPEDQQNGDIIDYRVEVFRGGSSAVEYVLSEFAVVDDLQPQSLYNVVITARNSEGMGPPSEPIPIQTCEINGKWNRTVDTLQCFAVSGYFELAEGQFASCADLTRHYPALEDAFCVDDNTTVDKLPVRAEFWRESLYSSEIVPCPRGDYCKPTALANASLGRPEDVNSYCTEHHEGIYCFSCEDGFVPTESGCVECNQDLERNAALTLFCGIFLLLLFLLMLWMRILYLAKILHPPRCMRWAFPAQENNESSADLNTKDSSSGRPTALKRSLASASPRTLRSGQSFARAAASMNVALKYTSRFSTFTKLRILFGFWQVFFSYQRSFQFHTINNPFSAVADGVSSMSISVILNRFQTRCALDHNHYHVLVFETLMPPVLMLILAGLCIWASHCTRTKSQRTRLYEEFMWSGFLLLFLVYPSVSQTIFETFRCETFNVTDLGHPSIVLRSDFRTDCSASPERTWWVVYAVAMILAYPIGVVALYAVNLRRYRKLVTKREKGAVELKRLTRISFLIYPYKPNIYWFETYELVRKLVQTSFIGLLPTPTPELQGLLALIAQNVTVAAIIVLVYLKPYRKLSDFMFAVITLVLLLPAAQLSIMDPFARAESTMPISVLGLILLLEFIVFLIFCTWDVASGMYGDDFWCYKQKCYKINSRFYEPNNYGASQLVNAHAAKREMQKVLDESQKLKLENNALRKALSDAGQDASAIALKGADAGYSGDPGQPQTRTQIVDDEDQDQHEIVNENMADNDVNLSPLKLKTSPRTLGNELDGGSRVDLNSEGSSESSVSSVKKEDVAIV